jgi:hypothetical protein|tara:strand:- start:312 stop:941 length:630 start_codon:yes stop_codon:yes gene_type:complete
MNDNFYEMSAKMKELFPSNPEADKKALLAMAGNTTPVETPAVVQESVEVAQGSLQMDKDYSISDFAALAGVNLTEGKQKTGSAGQLKGKDAITKSATPGGNESPHPARNKLVGEASADSLVGTLMAKVTELEARIARLENPVKERELSKGEETEKERIVKGMKKNKSDFKDRYGKDAEAVMYATATKNAKKNESIKDQLLKMLNEKKQK